jgi:hypothetical protein
MGFDNASDSTNRTDAGLWTTDRDGLPVVWRREKRSAVGILKADRHTQEQNHRQNEQASAIAKTRPATGAGRLRARCA